MCNFTLYSYTVDKSPEPPKVSQGETSEEPPVEEEEEKEVSLLGSHTLRKPDYFVYMCVYGMQKSTGSGDAVVNAELHLLERLLGRITKQATSSRCMLECSDECFELSSLPDR